MKNKEHRNSKFSKISETPFRKDMLTWYPNTRKLYNVTGIWEKTVGKYIADHSTLLGVFNEGILSVACEDGVISNELRLRSETVISKLNSELGFSYITALSFNNKKYRKKQPVPQAVSEKKEEKIPDITLSSEELADIEKKLENFEDGELKDKIRLVYTNAVKKEKAF